MAVLIGYERRRYQPLIDLRFFSSVPFSSATVIAVCGFAALSGFLFLNTLYLQNVRGLTPLHAGLATLPLALMSVLFAPVSGRFVGARGARVPLVIAGIGIAAAGLMLTGLDDHTPLAYILGTYAIFGFGFGWLNAPITNTAVSGMPREQAGTAAAIASTSRQVGQSLGVAVIGAAVASVMASMFGSSFAAASHVGWWIIAGCGVVVFVLGVVSTSAWAQGTAAEVVARTAEREPATVG
jgi:MFS family permease